MLSVSNGGMCDDASSDATSDDAARYDASSDAASSDASSDDAASYDASSDAALNEAFTDFVH